MAENESITNEPAASFDPAIQSEKLGFDAQQLVECDSCGRKNPPNRLTCLYCAGALAIDPQAVETITTGLRKPDTWERGFNLVLKAPLAHDAVDVDRAAQVLSLEKDDLVAIMQARLLLPVARADSERSANSVKDVLAKLGIETMVVSDQSLAEDKPPTRLRSISFDDNSFTLRLFNTGEDIVIQASDLVLVVEGVISVSRVDQLEKKRLRGANRMLDETSSTSDESLLDVYTRGDMNGYRVQTAGFDFSGLGAEKGMLAADNLKKLKDRLVNVSPEVKYIDEYRSLRQLLGYVWEIELRQESKGLQHAGIGQKGFGTVASTSNLSQFTKFSRLQRHLL